MGCYDTIAFKCPNCGNKIYTQSKGGECLLEEFPVTAVPISVALDANRHAPISCCKCGNNYVFNNIPNNEPIKTVCLTIRKCE